MGSGETVKFNSHLNSNFMSNCQHQQHLRGSVTKADCTISNVHPYQNCEKLEISKLILENPLWQGGNPPNRIGFNFVMTLCRGYFWISLLTLGYEMRPNLSINRKRIFWVWKVKSIKISDLLEWRHKARWMIWDFYTSGLTGQNLSTFQRFWRLLQHPIRINNLHQSIPRS